MIHELPREVGASRDVPPAERVIVGIPAFNEERHIERCIRSLVGNDPWMHALKIIVADGGSSDRTRDVVQALRGEFPNLDLIENRQRLQSAAMNLIAERASPADDAIIVRCDAHATYPVDYVRRVVTMLASCGTEVAALATVMDARGDGNCFQRALAWIIDTPLGSGGSAHRGGTRSGFVDHGHHAAFRLSWFRTVGGYDPNFSHNEDAELDHRFGRAGGRIWLEADIRFNYVVRDNPGGLARQYASYGAGRAANLIKHRARPRLRQLIPAINLAALGLCALASLVWPFALAPIGLYLLTLLAASLACVFSLVSVCGLWAGPALAILHNAWAVGFLMTLATRRGLGRGSIPRYSSGAADAVEEPDPAP